MAELTRAQRYKAILDNLCEEPAGLTTKELLSRLEKQYPGQEWAGVLYRDLNDLKEINWLETIGSHYFVSPELGRYLVARCRVLHLRAQNIEQEFATLLTATIRREE